MGSHVQTWQNYHSFADERGWLVTTILRRFTVLEGKKVLDYGCGDGGTARTFARFGADVTAVDIKDQVGQLFKNSDVKFFNAQKEDLYLAKEKYDIIILQDVLEHVTNPEKLLKQIKDALGTAGLIYISTPNRFSLLNLISDPHWNLPGVALFSRRAVQFFVQQIFRRDLRDRSDWAALLSLNRLKSLLKSNDFELIFVNTLVAKMLFQQSNAVVCHPTQLRLVQWLKRHHLDRWIYRCVNDQLGIFNFFINPTWYVVGKVG